MPSGLVAWQTMPDTRTVCQVAAALPWLDWCHQPPLSPGLGLVACRCTPNCQGCMLPLSCAAVAPYTTPHCLPGAPHAVTCTHAWVVSSSLSSDAGTWVLRMPWAQDLRRQRKSLRLGPQTLQGDQNTMSALRTCRQGAHYRLSKYVHDNTLLHCHATSHHHTPGTHTHRHMLHHTPQLTPTVPTLISLALYTNSSLGGLGGL